MLESKKDGEENYLKSFLLINNPTMKQINGLMDINWYGVGLKNGGHITGQS